MTRPISGLLAREGVPGLPHKAVLQVTGWIQPTRNGNTRIGALVLNPVPEQWRGQRVSVTLYPRTNGNGELHFPIHHAKIRPAQDHPNGTAFEIIGRLLSVGISNQQLRVRVYPPQGRVGSFELIVRGTPGVLRTVNPEWPAIRVTGGAIGSVLVADLIEPVYALAGPTGGREASGTAQTRQTAQARPGRERGRDVF